MARPNVETERREQILAATCEVLADKGRHSLRMSDVARQAGLSSGIIHYYFANKQEVLTAAFEFNFRNSLARHRALLDSDEPALSVLVHVIESYLPMTHTQTAWRVWAELWAEAMHDAQLKQINEALYGEWRDQVTQLVDRAQVDGEAREGNAGTYANMLIAIIDGLATQVLIGSDSMTAPQMRDIINEFIEACIARPNVPA